MDVNVETVKCFDFSSDSKMTREIIDAYHLDGVVCLKSAVPSYWLNKIEEGINIFLAKKKVEGDPSNVSVKHYGDTGQFHYATSMWKTIEPFKSFIFESGIPLRFGDILETTFLNLYYDFLLIKEAGCKSAVTPWHQDHSYYCLNGMKIINCWTALDKIPQKTALRFVKRISTLNKVHQAVHFDPNKEYDKTIKTRPKPPDFYNDPNYQILYSEMDPGDTLIWNSRTFHSAPGNDLMTRRGALSINLAGDDVTYYDMEQEPDPPIRGENLKDGSLITCESFPLLKTN